MSADDLPGEGWAQPPSARLWHYFKADGRSLCGKWFRMTVAGLEAGNNTSLDNCTACRKKILTNIAPARQPC